MRKFPPSLSPLSLPSPPWSESTTIVVATKAGFTIIYLVTRNHNTSSSSTVHQSSSPRHHRQQSDRQTDRPGDVCVARVMRPSGGDNSSDLRRLRPAAVVTPLTSTDRRPRSRRILTRSDMSWLVLHRSFLAIFLIFMQVFAACAAMNSAEQLGNRALCPFDVRIDEDPSRIPKEIKQHTCRKMVSRNVGGGEDEEDGGDHLTCAGIGGHCVQVHETIKVQYRHRTLSHRKHDIRVNMSCVCVPLRGKPAAEISPEITR